jgi:riboflavin biosynthesis pyrimidine reductase
MTLETFGLAKDLEVSDIASLAKAYGPWQGIRANHVVTQTGSFSGADGSSRSISTTEDRELLIALRKMADVILVDAATARKEQYRAPKAGALLAIFSSSGSFERIPAVQESPERTLLFAGNQSSAGTLETNARLWVSSNPLTTFQLVAEELGLRSSLLEAGPTLSRQAFEMDLVSESALTITPATTANFRFQHPLTESLSLVSVARMADASFTYWRR